MSTDVTTAPAKAEKISMRGIPLLSAGRTNQPLAQAENLWLRAKVYAEGGENSMHAHHSEDHAFFVLAGEATFTLGDGSQIVAGPYEGIMLPKGALYHFRSTADENLVLLRIGAGVGPLTPRRSVDGKPIKSAGEPVLSGEYFMQP